MHGVEVERHDGDARIVGIGGGGTTEIMNEVVAGRSGLDHAEHGSGAGMTEELP